MCKIVKWIIGASLTLALAGQATAAPMFYTNEADFLNRASNAGISLDLESFESTSGVAPMSVGGIAITNTDGSIVVQSWAFATDGLKSIGWHRSGQGAITYAFDDPINAFGIDIMDLGDNGVTTLTLTTSTGDSIDLFEGFTGANGNIQFGGVIDNATAFIAATFSNTNRSDFIAFDRLQYGYGGTDLSNQFNPSIQSSDVPEPATLPIFGLGLVGLGFMRRKRVS